MPRDLTALLLVGLVCAPPLLAAQAAPHDDLLGDGAIDDPHALYARLRSRQPLARVGDSGVHVVARWALIDEVLRREGDFSANLTGVLVRADAGVPAIFPFPGSSGK